MKKILFIFLAVIGLVKGLFANEVVIGTIENSGNNIKQCIFLESKFKFIRLLYIYPTRAALTQDSLERASKNLKKTICTDPILNPKIKLGYKVIVTFVYKDQTIETVIDNCKSE